MRDDTRTIALNSNYQIPRLGIGVFLATPEVCEESVLRALKLGIRHIDTAVAYMNERAVGRAIKRSGVKREEIFLTTKLWPTQYQKVEEAIDDLLKRLDTNYIDLLLLHQPYGAYLEAYKAMEKAVEEGKVRSIGLSNFDLEFFKFEEIVKEANILPAVLQVECHPYYQQRGLKEKIAKYGTRLEAWYPLGHGDKTLFEEETLKRLSNKYQKSVPQIILRWHLQEGNIIFPSANNPQHLQENSEIFDFELLDSEIEEIRKLDCGKRYYYLEPEVAANRYLGMDIDFNAQK